MFTAQSATAANPRKPNLFNPAANATSVRHLLPETQFKYPTLTPDPNALSPMGCKNTSFAMQPASLSLSPTSASTFTSSDGRLGVSVPAGAVSSAQLASDGGSTSLLIRQIQTASGSNAGGSGEVSLGSYLIQVTTASGQLAIHGLLLPVTLTLNYSKGDSALELGNAFVVLNGSVPPCINLDPSSVVLQPGTTKAASKPTAPITSSRTKFQATFGKLASHATTLKLGADPAAGTGSLSTSTMLSSPSTSVSWGTDSPVATFGKPQPFEVDLSGASLTTGYPIDVPAGPKGFKPPLTLAYTSAAVNDQHNPQAAAGWAGEGWNMGLGAISWAEHYVAESGGTHWQDSWQLSDPYGTAATLIPPATNTATYYEDSGNAITGSPVQWHTAPETYAKVYSFQNPSPPGAFSGYAAPPCFRVFLKNGIMEEFGCTGDSLQYYPGTNNKPYISSWLLDLIIEPDGNQIHINYLQDMETSSGGVIYPRDAVLQSITWDSPTCYNQTQTACTGTAAPNLWQPLLQVYFGANNVVAHVPTGYTPCLTSPGLGLRCDDAADLSGSGGLAAPLVQSVFVLNDIYVQVCNAPPCTTNAAWNTLRDYRLGYDETAPTTYQDPVSGKNESTAGKLTLNQITVLGDDGSTALPVTNFTYSSQTEYYEDSLEYPTPSTYCGPSWNTGYTPHNRGCVLWSQSRDANSYYLSTASNGMGLAQTFTWQNLRDNMHSVTWGGNPAESVYCTNAENGVTGYSGGSVYPCDMTDDETWSRVGIASMTNSLVRLTQAGQNGTQTNTPVTGTYTYQFWGVYPLAAQECPDCVAGFSWGDQYDNDYLDFYNGTFMGLWQAWVTHPDGSGDLHKFYSTEGWGGWTTAGQNGLTLSCPAAPTDVCHYDPYWDVANQTTYAGEANALHGHEYELDHRDTNGTTVLQSVLTQYTPVCTPPWIANFSPSVSGYTNNSWGGELVASLDLGNPMVACDVQTTQVDNKSVDGASGTVPDQTTTYAYETGSRPCSSCYGRQTKITTSSNDGGSNGSPTSIVKTTAYIWNDSITTSSTAAAGWYLIDFPAFQDVEDSSANRYQCTYLYYDPLTGWTHGQATTGANANLKAGDLHDQDRWTSCGTSPSFTPSGQISTGYGYSDGTYPYGNLWWSDDPDSYAGVSGHTGCIVNSVARSTCTAWDGYFQALPTTTSNALSQTTSTNIYQPHGSATAAGGFGLWPTSTIDANNQSTTYTYDALGRLINTSLPGEASSFTTQMAYDVWCSGIAAQSPCAEIDQIQRLDATHTITYRAFYDGLGHLAETRSPAPAGKDIVQYYFYDPSGRQVFKSIPYLVTAYTGAAGSAAYSIPDTTVAGTCTGTTNCTVPGYDGLGRVTKMTDALSETTSTAYSVVCNAPGTGDSACYEQTMTTDALNHQAGVLIDAMGRANYEQRYTGNSPGTYALYATAKYTYDRLGDLTKITRPDGTTVTSFSYDMAGRQTGLGDPDRGNECYVYDADGNMTQSTDARSWNGTCSVGSVFIGYDGIDRPIWRNTTNSSSAAYQTFAYDSTAGGNVGVGRLTSEAFTGAGMSGSETFTYNGRGQETATTLQVGVPSYPTTAMTYNDAGSLLTETYPDGEVITNSYETGAGWLSSVTSTSGSTTTTLLSNAAYATSSGNFGGAFGEMTSASLDGVAPVFSFSATYDPLNRPTDLKTQKVSGGAIMFDQSRAFDAAGNVTSASTTLTTGTDNQAFCYDEQNRLTWASSATGTPPCGGQANTAGSIPTYTQSFGYDNMGRLASGPGGTYAYQYNHPGTGPIDGANAISPNGYTGYTAGFDASGNMICRNPTSTFTSNCIVGIISGQLLTYDNEGRMSGWQDQQSGPTTTTAYLYDGQGNRVAQAVTNGSGTTTTTYVGGLEEATSSGTTTTYYYANSWRFALAVNGTFDYLASDGLGSANVTLAANGTVIASILYAPYGGARYTSGSMPTDRGFTGQVADSSSGLDYYASRYYDPVAGQFAVADSVIPGKGFDVWGLSRFAYVEGNPPTLIDPTGHLGTCAADPSDPTCGDLHGGGQSSGGGTTTGGGGSGTTGQSSKPPGSVFPWPAIVFPSQRCTTTSSILGCLGCVQSTQMCDPCLAIGNPCNGCLSYIGLAFGLCNTNEKPPTTTSNEPTTSACPAGATCMTRRERQRVQLIGIGLGFSILLSALLRYTSGWGGNGSNPGCGSGGYPGSGATPLAGPPPSYAPCPTPAPTEYDIPDDNDK